jgi:histone deacetylase 1/2
VTCQICGKQGHSAYRCWHRYSEDDGEEEEEERGANAASYGVDTNWYSDTGATDHITSELDKLTMKEKYHGRDKINAANGAGMNISHIGHALVKSPSKHFHLNNVLHVPSATKNLVSIHRLTRDNHVYVRFHPWYFYVKDLETKKILLKGRCTGGLYPLVSSTSSNKRDLSATKPSATRWHDHLGHPSFKVVQRVLRSFNLPFSISLGVILFVIHVKERKVINFLILDQPVCQPNH